MRRRLSDPIRPAVAGAVLLLLAQAGTAQNDSVARPVAPEGPASETDARDPAADVLAQVLEQMPPPEAPAVASAVLVLNQERLLSQSLYGLRIQRELEAASSALATENREIEARLTEEELRLTDLRRTMPTEDFREMAAEFDTRVEQIRSAQEAKGRALQAAVERAQQQFFDLVVPVLLDLVRARGASVLMDSRAILLVADGVDITDQAIARIDRTLGEGGEDPLISIDGSSGARDGR